MDDTNRSQTHKARDDGLAAQRPHKLCNLQLLDNYCLFNTTLTGPGRVYIQSYSKEKFMMALMMLGGGGGKGGGGGGGGAPAEAAEMER